MDYEKKYKEALEGIRKLYNSDCDMIRVKRLKRRLNLIFPELKESEDEKMRKEIIDFLRLPHPQFVGKRDHEKWIAWLEKQGEKKPTENVEIKFCEGDKVVSNQDGKVYTVGTAYYVTGDNICLHDTDGNHKWTNKDDLNRNYHLWTIKDASDGDILVNGSNIFIFSHISKETRVMGYCHVNVDNNKFYIDNAFYTSFFDTSFGTIDAEFTVASQEQRELLFKKMKEEGYEWDSEKKELKKIESKKLDADKVIAWLVNNICYFEYYVKLFKEDFEL